MKEPKKLKSLIDPDDCRLRADFNTFSTACTFLLIDFRKEIRNLDSFRRTFLFTFLTADTADLTGHLDLLTLVVGTTEDVDLLGCLCKGKDSIRTGRDTVSTARTEVLVNHREAVFSHGKGIELAGPDTGPKTHTAVSTALSGITEHKGSLAAFHSLIIIKGGAAVVSALAEDKGVLRFGLGNFLAEQSPDLLCGFKTANRATINRSTTFYNGFGAGSTSRKPTATTVCSGQEFGNLINQRIGIDLEDLGRGDKHHTHSQPEARKNSYRVYEYSISQAGSPRRSSRKTWT